MSEKKSGCKSCGIKNEEDKCSKCKVYIPVVGPQGPPGPPGPPGIPGAGTIIPYGSGNRFPVVVPPNSSNTIFSTIGFGSHHEFSSVDNALQNSEDVFIVPRDGRVRSLFFAAYFDQNNVLEVGPVIAELWRSSDGNNFDHFPFPISVTTLGIDFPYLAGNIELLAAESVSAGDYLMLVISFSFVAAGGESPRTALLGFRAGVGIE